MKKHITLILILLFLTAVFGVNRQLKINSLNKTIDSAGAILINGYYNKSNLNYNFDLVEKELTKQNIEALARELSYTQSLFCSIIQLNKGKLNDEVWQQFESVRSEYKSVNYIFSLTGKAQMSEKDKENLSKLKDIFNNFYTSMGNDTTLFGVSNINSLTGSYIDFIRQIEGLFSV